MLKRVVVTGLGIVSPNGSAINTFWNNICEGRSAIGPITRFDASLFRTRIGSEIKNFDPSALLDRNTIKRTDIFTQYALLSADQAIKASGFSMDSMDPFDVGVIWGTGQGGMETYEEQVAGFVKGDGHPRFSPFLIPKFLPNMAAGLISIMHGFMGINYTTISACATSNSAIMDAFNYIRLGKAKIIITGGSEAPITPASFGGFSAMKAMSHRNEAPQQASRPFDIDRDGFVMAEGAGALVLEEYDHAVQRGATIFGEIGGASMTADAYHMTATHPEGKGAVQAMRLALREAGVTTDDLDYLNPHATSTPVGDLSEARAIAALMGSADNRLLISATKSVTGHLLGAAGAVEAVITLLAMKHNMVPPTINTTRPDPEIPANLHIVTGAARDKKINVALSNTFGFGGHNATVVFKKI
ncbi:MAG: beta-ketoacyl-ACP synthase II [Flavihumibacter sp.]